ncbi:hypothetical protein BOFE_10480 (plasmid) [Candidatus Borrelia fainii]|uniref:Variable large protein n=1 Tax=Candidatus Borrelia fainii TaxID=2518322 RepID=A0ABN6UUT5_9SPIR|nr:variable large family protein [Candidatus Borrelia fainii]BDU63418.1 hypothetical protein BOFE_09580 [Candidatus Borrelia fainii]BDU63508.1 hypothetical protein BOFE_10480 [Candidatus Borrelia fainii]
MKRITLSALLMTLFLLLSCGSGSANVEDPKSKFLQSIISLSNAIGDAFGLTSVKSDDNRSKVGEYFKNIGYGLSTTNDKLKKLSNEISESKNSNESAIDAVKGAIKSASDVFEKLIAALTKLAGATGNTVIGDAGAAGAAAADKDSVNTVIGEIKNIIDAAEKSGVNIEKGNAGATVDNGNGPKALTNNAQASEGDAAKLAGEVAKADPWAMIDKIKNSAVVAAPAAPAAGDDAGKLATGTAAAANAGTAATNADLAAAVALKAMTKDGKFTQPHANETEAVKAAAVTAVNKVLGVLDFIIRKTVAINLDKIRKAVQSETTTGAAEASEKQ